MEARDDGRQLQNDAALISSLSNEIEGLGVAIYGVIFLIYQWQPIWLLWLIWDSAVFN